MIISTSKVAYHTKANYNITSALVSTDYKDPPTILRGGCDMDTAVRRLMPIECERLQGYPDNWTLIGEPEENPKTGEIEYFYIDSNGKKKKVSDSARYKALGNSICLPFWEWMARRICSQYERKVTMGSLFDGIGGFPLVFQNVGAFPIWASEIEEFPMAVTKERFPEDD